MANFNLNKVIMGGRLTSDPELKQTTSGISVVSFGIAVNRKYQSKGTDQAQQADFFNVVAWRATAEFISRYFKKGSSICISGSLQSRNWQDQQGQKRTTIEIVVDEAYFVDSKSDSAGASDQYTPDSYAVPSYAGAAGAAPKFEEIADDDDLPF